MPGSYHHGHLAEALLTEAVARARAGGPAAIVLREVARAVGVSPNAAYRHYADLAALTKAVAHQARAEMGRWMLAELSRAEPVDDPGRDALRRTLAVGRGYVRFALGEPGLFRAAFAQSPGVPDAPPPEDDESSPWGLLHVALGRLEAAGLLAGTREEAAVFAWGAVHGLAELALVGVLEEVSDDLLEAQLGYIGRALVRPGAT
jgi:AcrR family transcriptional regulator